MKIEREKIVKYAAMALGVVVFLSLALYLKLIYTEDYFPAKVVNNADAIRKNVGPDGKSVLIDPVSGKVVDLAQPTADVVSASEYEQLKAQQAVTNKRPPQLLSTNPQVRLSGGMQIIEKKQ